MAPQFILALANLSVSALVIGLSVPLLLGKIGPNRFYGVRIPQCQHSPEAWYAINRYGGRQLILFFLFFACLNLPLLLPIRAPDSVLIGIALFPTATIFTLIPIWRYANRYIAEHPQDPPGQAPSE